MVKSRRHHSPVSVTSSSPCSPSSPSPAASSLSLISNPPQLKPSTAACTPFISSLKKCPRLLDVSTEFSVLGLGEGKGPAGREDMPELQLGRAEVAGNRPAEDLGRTAAGYCGRTRLQQHWIQVGGNVIIPDTWGLEQHLQEWVSYGLVEDALKPAGLMSARSALVADSAATTAAQRRARGSAASAVAASTSSTSSSLQQPTPPQLLVSSADPVQVSSCG